MKQIWRGLWKRDWLMPGETWGPLPRRICLICQATRTNSDFETANVWQMTGGNGGDERLDAHSQTTPSIYLAAHQFAGQLRDSGGRKRCEHYGIMINVCSCFLCIQFTFMADKKGCYSDCDSGCRWFEPRQPPHIFKQLAFMTEILPNLEEPSS